jgi:hypothetical protein
VYTQRFATEHARAASNYILPSFLKKMKRRHGNKCTCCASSKIATEYYQPLLKKFKRLNKAGRQKVFEECDQCFIKFIGETCKAVLCNYIKLPEYMYEKLRRHKNIKEDLKYLANESIPIKRKRALLLNKGGGFLSIILPALASSLISLIGNTIANHYSK